MKYNAMGINREKNKKSYGHYLELLFVEPNILAVSWRQVCDNPLATIVWGQILSKENDIVPPSYLFSVCLLCKPCSSIITLCNIFNNY